MSGRHRPRRREAGFTLFEVLVAVLAAGFFASAGALVLVGSADVAERSGATEKLVSDGRRALDRFCRDAHRLRGGTSLDLLEMSPARFRFVDRAGATITWELAGSTLRRNGADALDGVQSLAFSYRLSSGLGPLDPDTASRVEVVLTLSDGLFSETLRETVVPRCFVFPFAGFGGS